MLVSGATPTRTANGLAELRFYSDLFAAGEQVDVFGATVVVASLAMIIESKEGAGRAVDDQALPHLREIQKSIDADTDVGLLSLGSGSFEEAERTMSRFT